jgi:hypothetical protein
MRRSLGAVAVAVACAVACTGCATGEAAEPIPVEVAPFGAPAGLTFTEEQGVDDRLARAGDDALIGAARLWRLERSGRVVGAVQVATWAPDVAGTDDARSTLLAAVHTGRTESRHVHGVAVTISQEPAAPGDARPGLIRASWFTRAGFALLSLREDLDLDAVLPPAVAATAGAPR